VDFLHLGTLEYLVERDRGNRNLDRLQAVALVVLDDLAHRG
jgi:hypothetical protein